MGNAKSGVTEGSEQGVNTFSLEMQQLSDLPDTIDLPQVIVDGVHQLQESHEGLERGAVSYVDLNGGLQFELLPKGFDANLSFVVAIDLATPWLKRDYAQFGFLISRIEEVNQVPGLSCFILLPKEPIVGGVELGSKNVVRKGKSVVGNFHVHPSGNPISIGDFVNALYSTDVINAVVGGETIFQVSVPLKYTPPVEDSDLLKAEMEQEFNAYCADRENIPEQYLRVMFLIEKAREIGVALYSGPASTGRLKRLQ